MDHGPETDGLHDLLTAVGTGVVQYLHLDHVRRAGAGRPRTGT